MHKSFVGLCCCPVQSRLWVWGAVQSKQGVMLYSVGSGHYNDHKHASNSFYNFQSISIRLLYLD